MRKHGLSTVQWQSAQVVRVVDGDTLDLAIIEPDGTLKSPERWRLAGIDAPEIQPKTNAVSAQCWRAENAPGVWARAHLMNIVAERVVLVKASKAWTDPYGRIIGRVRVGAIDVSSKMVMDGHASPWFPRAKRLLHEVNAQLATDRALKLKRESLGRPQVDQTQL